MPTELDRVLDALDKSTTSSASLETRVGQLISKQELTDERTDDRLSGLEDGMGTMNAHLDNLEREAAKTNLLLERDYTFRQEQHKEAQEEKRRTTDLARQDVKDRRAIASKAASEVWTVFKQPLATLVLAIGAYFAWANLQIPPTPVPVQVIAADAAEAPGVGMKEANAAGPDD